LARIPSNNSKNWDLAFINLPAKVFALIKNSSVLRQLVKQVTEIGEHWSWPGKASQCASFPLYLPSVLEPHHCIPGQRLSPGLLADSFSRPQHTHSVAEKSSSNAVSIISFSGLAQ
jgi:hypothetical protein